MKTTLYIPLMHSSITPETRSVYADRLQELAADVVWIALDRYTLFLSDRSAEMARLKENIGFFRVQGLGVGVWIQAFGFGNSLPAEAETVTADWVKLYSLGGHTVGDAFCPEDPRFMEQYLGWVTDVVACAPDMLMLDDDLCQSVRPGLGCVCRYHRKRLDAILQERGLAPLQEPSSAWPARFFAGEGGEDRRAFLDVMGDSLRLFCRQVREAVDAVDQTIRVGFCAGYTSWDLEGADAAELTRLLAGPHTKPFLRLTGAPYWVTKDMHRFEGQRLNTVIEFARAQEAWCRLKGGDIEIFAEADSYPRPRYHIPSAYIDCFDMACRVSGGMGMLKYVFDYYAMPDVETGYVKRHLRNQPQYEAAERLFEDKTARGVYVYEPMRKAADMHLPEAFSGEQSVMNSAFSPAATMLSALSIPTVYDLPKDGCPECAIAFGDCAKAINELPRKLILDLPAARILAERGIDVGLRNVTPHADIPQYERYHDLEAGARYAPGHTSLQFQYAPYSRVTPHEDAEILSVFEGEADAFPSAYRYRNRETEFYVLCVDAYALRPNCSVFLSYGRQAQLLDFIGSIPHVAGQPCVYTLWKEGTGESALLVMNLCEDVLFDFDLVLDRTYSHAEIFGSDGVFLGDRIRVVGDVRPFASICVKLKH